MIADDDFSISHDPFLHVLQRMHLTRDNGRPRTVVIVAIAWVPLVLGALVRVVVGHRPAPILFDISVHARLLVVIPMFVLAERMLESRCRGAIHQLFDGNFADRTRVEPIVERGIRLYTSRVCELAILVIVVVFAQVLLWGGFGATGLVSGIDDPGATSVARVWYASVSLPIMQFLMARWVWHWLIWSYVVIHVSRLKLATIATHPDHAAGLGFLASPVSGFWVFVAGVSATLAAAWGTQLNAGATLKSFAPMFAAFIVSAVILACGPMLAYVGLLYRARHRELRRYNGFALAYMRAFDRKWIGAHPEEQHALGARDIQALNDLGGAYTDLAKVRPVPFGPRALHGIWIAAVVPMVPLVVSTMPIADMLRKLAGPILGG